MGMTCTYYVMQSSIVKVNDINYIQNLFQHMGNEREVVSI